jgi:hypothetical protein
MDDPEHINTHENSNKAQTHNLLDHRYVRREILMSHVWHNDKELRIQRGDGLEVVRDIFLGII